MIRLGLLLAATRHATGKKVRESADQINISKSFFTLIENIQRIPKKTEHIYEIAKFCGIDNGEASSMVWWEKFHNNLPDDLILFIKKEIINLISGSIIINTWNNNPKCYLLMPDYLQNEKEIYTCIKYLIQKLGIYDMELINYKKLNFNNLRVEDLKSHNITDVITSKFNNINTIDLFTFIESININSNSIGIKSLLPSIYKLTDNDNRDNIIDIYDTKYIYYELGNYYIL